MASERYRPGQIERRKLRDGWCYYVRIQVTRATGEVVRKRVRVGMEKDFPSRSAAARAARVVIDDFNAQPEAILGEKRRFSAVIDRYAAEEMPKRHATQKGYRSILKNHIEPRWGSEFLAAIKPLQVREWLRALPLSTRRRGNIHGLMRVLYRFAMLWEWIPADVNPMSLFRLEGSTKRAKEPGILTLEQFTAVLEALESPTYKTMAILAGSTGLRCSELFALRWNDVDFTQLTLRVERGVVDQILGDVKNSSLQEAFAVGPAFGNSSSLLPAANPVPPRQRTGCLRALGLAGRCRTVQTTSSAGT